MHVAALRSGSVSFTYCLSKAPTCNYLTNSTSRSWHACVWFLVHVSHTAGRSAEVLPSSAGVLRGISFSACHL